MNLEWNEKIPWIKHMKIVQKGILIASLILFISCNPEYRLYKRVGGEHLHLKSANKELFWFNGVHGNDPKNPMFNDIKTEFQQFNPDVVLVEGHANLVNLSDELSAKKSGENVYVGFLAKESGKVCMDIEPSDAEVNEYLIKLYGKKDVLTMYLIRQMVQWQREKNSDNEFEKRVIDYLTWENKNIGYFTGEITLDQVSELLMPHSNLNLINNSNWIDFNAKEYIYFSENQISKIYNDISNVRNQYLLKVIKKNLTNYNKIFIMMGFDHAKEVKKELFNIFGAK